MTLKIKVSSFNNETIDKIILFLHFGLESLITSKRLVQNPHCSSDHLRVCQWYIGEYVEQW